MLRLFLTGAAACALALGAAAQAPEFELVEEPNRNGQGSNKFGRSVDLVDDYLIAGAPDGGHLSQGIAHVLRREAGAWVWEVSLQTTQGVIADQGTSVRVLPETAEHAGLALVGGSGLAILYERSGGVWTTDFRQFDPDDISGIGWAVGLARDADGAAYAAVGGGGELKVWRRLPGAGLAGWSLDGCFVRAGNYAATQAALWTGADGAVSVAVKRRGRTEVEVHRRTGGTDVECGGVWEMEAVLAPSALAAGESFAYEVQADAAHRVPRAGGTPDRLVVGAPVLDFFGDGGSAFVYTRDAAGGWAEEVRLSRTEPPGFFGQMMALSGDVLATNGISTFVYRREASGAWPRVYEYAPFEVAGSVPRDPAFAMQGDAVVEGDHLWDIPGRGGTDQGIVRVFRLPATVVAEEAGPSASASVTVAPNPSGGRFTVGVDLASPSAVRVTVLDALGRAVWRGGGARAAGRGEVSVDGGRWPPGVYLVRVEAGGGVTTRAVTVVR